MADRVSIAAFRFGYGLPARPEMASAEGLLAALAGPDEAAERWPSITVADLMPVIEEFLRIKKAGKAEADNAKAKANLKDVAGVSDQLAVRGAKAALARAVGAEDPLRERLVQFWADHFTTVARNRIERALPATMIEEAIRPNLMRPFAEMLKAVVTHPAMLIYLNQASSVGPGSRLGMRQGKGLNENLARELLESHTLGVGAGYAQDDVRQMAELLTGLSLRPGTGFVFDPRQAEPGPETVLGVTYRGEGVRQSSAPWRHWRCGPRRRGIWRASWRCISCRMSRMPGWFQGWRPRGATVVAIWRWRSGGGDGGLGAARGGLGAGGGQGTATVRFCGGIAARFGRFGG